MKLKCIENVVKFTELTYYIYGMKFKSVVIVV